MDFDSVMKSGAQCWAPGGVVVIDEDTCMLDLAQRIIHFYAHESLRAGAFHREELEWLRKMLDRFHGGDGAPPKIFR